MLRLEPDFFDGGILRATDEEIALQLVSFIQNSSKSFLRVQHLGRQHLGEILSQFLYQG